MKRAILSFMFAFIGMVLVNAQTDGSKRKPKQQVTVRSSSSQKRSTPTSVSKKNNGDKTKISSSNQASSQPTSGVSNSTNTSNVKESTYSNGHEYVDLGLSVKWATCNVGAKTPEDYGDYYAWGETETIETKSIYKWSTYKWCKGSKDTMTKYCTNSSYGTVDNKTTLDPEDDVAHVKWGGIWRIPTRAEQDELRNPNNCTWTWTTQGGKNGYKVTSKMNGNSIFLPTAGCCGDSSLSGADSYGRYSSSSLYSFDSYRTYSLFFSSNGVSWSYYARYYGQSVRPVCP